MFLIKIINIVHITQQKIFGTMNKKYKFVNLTLKWDL